jgi:hypothetical protein
MQVCAVLLMSVALAAVPVAGQLNTSPTWRPANVDVHGAGLPARATEFHMPSPSPPSTTDAHSTSGPTPAPGVNVVGSQVSSAAAETISDVPAYIWHHGCGPTAAGMLLGYWDAHGFDALVAGDASSQTSAVNEMIASEGTASNYTDYCLPLDSPSVNATPLPDLSEPPAGDEHADECLADYMKTSQSARDNYYGWSWFSDVGRGMVDYVEALGEGYVATVYKHFMSDGTLTWTSFRDEIDKGRPMVFLVDTDADGTTDHFVTAVGYDDGGGLVERYGCLNTWDSAVHWWDFEPMASGQAWGIYGALSFEISQPANSPPTLGTVVPSSGSGSAGDATYFITSWRDADGWQDLKQCYFHVGASPTLANNVTLLYNAQQDKLWIRSDDGTQWLGGYAPESSNILQNTQAKVYCSQTRRAASGDTLEMKWAIEFQPAYTGSKKTGLKCRDVSGAKAAGAWKGAWTVE